MSMVDESEQSGKSLRDRLEEAIAANKAMSDQLHSYKVRDTLAEKGFKLVKAEELAGVPLDEVEKRAQQIQEERDQFRREAVKEVLAKQGVEGEDLDAMVTDLLEERQAASPEAEATRRAQGVGRAEGSVVPRVNPNELHGYDAMVAAFSGQQKK